MIKKEVALFYKDAGSDKVYNLKMQENSAGLFTVDFQYGKRGSKLKDGTKTNTPVSFEEAQKIYDSLLKEKTAKGYSSIEGAAAFQSVELKDRVTGLTPQLLNNLKESTWETMLKNDDWMMQEKYDGRRLIVQSFNGKAIGINKKGLAIELMQEVKNIIKRINFDIELDGELMPDGKYHIFDILHKGSESTKDMSAFDRYQLLCSIKELTEHVAPTYFNYEDKKAALKKLQEDKKEGFVVKHKDSKYVPGRPASGGNQLKGKFWESGTFKVMSLNSSKRSIKVGAFKDNVLTDMGNVTVPPNYDVPSVGEFVEVIYLYCTPGDNGKLYQSKYKGIRDDQNDEDCDFSKVKIKNNINDDEEDEIEQEVEMSSKDDKIKEKMKKAI